MQTEIFCDKDRHDWNMYSAVFISAIEWRQNYSFGSYRSKWKSNKKLLKIDFKAKNCSANCGCYEPINGGKEQVVPLQSTSQLYMEGLR